MSTHHDSEINGGQFGERTPLPSTALSDYLVLDLTRVRSGPTCVRQLADWGADVIKIEAPNDKSAMGGPRTGPDFQNLHRNKRSMALNLKSEEGKKIFKKLAEKADVVVENFRPDVKYRLGIDFDSLSIKNPGLIYASISGFGQDGPLADRPGFDQIAQGMGGLMSITGEPGRGPMRVGIPIADLCAGLFAAQAIFIALLERSKSGKGQWVQTSLLQAQAFMLDFQAARYLMDGDVPKQAGNNHPTSIPTGVFKTSDGFINLAVAGELIWKRLAETLERPEWCDDERFAINESRSQNRDLLNAEIEKITRTQTSNFWVDKLNEAVKEENIPVVMASILDEQKQGLALGANDYVSKPVNRDKLITALRRFVGSGPGKSVLVVEDDPDSRMFLRRLLRSEEYEVFEAVNGKEGLDQLEVMDVNPDIILLDLMMPVMDGFEFLDRIKKIESKSEIPILVVTAADLNEKDLERLRGGVENIIQKSEMTRDQIVQEVSTLITSNSGTG